MTINEAIAHALEVAEQNEKKAKYRPRMDYYDNELESREDCLKHASDLRQLIEWLMELKEAKRLLKAAVEDLNATVAEVYNGGVICERCKWESQIGECSCPNDGGCDTDYQWRYADEALKLIGGTSV